MAATLACALALALAGASAAIAASASVAMRSVQFDPRAASVNVGDSVSWTNFDGIPHSAAADNGSFDTGVFSTGSRTVTFTTAGTIAYHCAVHPTTMTGTITVVGPATPPPTAPPPPPPTAPPTPPPTAPPPVVTRSPAPAAPTTALPTPSPTPQPTPSPTVAATATPQPSPTLAAQVSPQVITPPSATNGQQAGEGPLPVIPLVAVAAGIALIGTAIVLMKRA